MSEVIKIQTKSFVKVHVTNSQNDSVSFENKFAKDLTVAELKAKLEIITGGNAGTMEVELYSNNKLITKLTDNQCLLGSYPIEDGMRLHVIDNFHYITENVQKFNLTDEEYSSRDNTVRDFLKKNRLGKYNEEELKRLEEKRIADEQEEEKLAEKAQIGLRCMVTTSKGPRRIGTIMYNGPLDGKPGIFIGVKFDEPLGVNDGSVNGKRYFECAPKYGSMVPVANVTVGDFPPEEYNLDEEL